MVISKAQANTQTNRNTSEDVMLFSGAHEACIFTTTVVMNRKTMFFYTCHTKENTLVSGVITNDTT